MEKWFHISEIQNQCSTDTSGQCDIWILQFSNALERGSSENCMGENFMYGLKGAVDKKNPLFYSTIDCKKNGCEF